MNNTSQHNSKKTQNKTSELEKFRLFFEYVNSAPQKQGGTFSVEHRLAQHRHGRQ